MPKGKLNKGHWHEVTDRTLCVIDIVETMLFHHPAIQKSPALKKKILKVQDILGTVYQKSGSKM